jgi:hypothetical protein
MFGKDLGPANTPKELGKYRQTSKGRHRLRSLS